MIMSVRFARSIFNTAVMSSKRNAKKNLDMGANPYLFFCYFEVFLFWHLYILFVFRFILKFFSPSKFLVYFHFLFFTSYFLFYFYLFLDFMLFFSLFSVFGFCLSLYNYLSFTYRSLLVIRYPRQGDLITIVCCLCYLVYRSLPV